MPRVESFGVEKTLRILTSEPSSATQSVNVPPVSTPIRVGGMAFKRRLAPRTAHCSGIRGDGNGLVRRIGLERALPLGEGKRRLGEKRPVNTKSWAIHASDARA